MHKHRKLFLFAGFMMVAFILVGCWLVFPMQGEDVGEETVYNRVIAHAGGGIDGHVYTNSKEAIMRAVERGCEYVEVDLFHTADNQLICLHEFTDYPEFLNNLDLKKLTSDEFKNTLILGKYHSMTFEEVLQLQKSLGFVLVTDKISSPELLNRYVTNKRDRAHIMVEAFSIEDYKQLRKDGYIPMLSLEAGLRNLLKNYYIILSNQVEWVALGTDYCPSWYIRSLKRLTDVKVAMFTINDIDEAKNRLGREADLIYSDSLMR